MITTITSDSQNISTIDALWVLSSQGFNRKVACRADSSQNASTAEDGKRQFNKSIR